MLDFSGVFWDGGEKIRVKDGFSVAVDEVESLLDLDSSRKVLQCAILA